MAALTTVAEARLLCGPAERIFTALQSVHNEFPVAGGKSGKIGSTVLVMSKVGSWSLVKVYAANRVCVMDSGNGWYFYKGETPKVYKWDTAPS